MRWQCVHMVSKRGLQLKRHKRHKRIDVMEILTFVNRKCPLAAAARVHNVTRAEDVVIQ